MLRSPRLATELDAALGHRSGVHKLPGHGPGAAHQRAERAGVPVPVAPPSLESKGHEPVSPPNGWEKLELEVKAWHVKMLRAESPFPWSQRA